jgi:hypothetical protein
MSLKAIAAESRTRLLLLFMSPGSSENSIVSAEPSSVMTEQLLLGKKSRCHFGPVRNEVAALRFRIFSSGSLR